MKALFRCDATEHIGFGHLSRCIALAEALQLSNVTSMFAGHFDIAAKQQLAIAGFQCLEFDQPLNTETAEREHTAITASQAADFVVIDSYRADEKYLIGLHSLGQSTVVIDDFRTLESYPCDVVLNFTWEAASLGYPDGPVLLLGPEYLPARRRLVECRQRSIERDRTGNVQALLIAVGGTDPKGIVTRITRLLSGMNYDICVHAIAENTQELDALMAGFAAGSRILERQPDLSDQLVWADAAITGGGLLKYESAYMGVPVAAIAQNEGQDGETQVFARAGLVFDLGLADSLSDDELARRLDRFLSNASLRKAMMGRMRDTFVPDPAARAANAILEALRR